MRGRTTLNKPSAWRKRVVYLHAAANSTDPNIQYNGRRCFRSVDFVSEASSKLVAIDEETTFHQI